MSGENLMANLVLNDPTQNKQTQNKQKKKKKKQTQEKKLTEIKKQTQIEKPKRRRIFSSQQKLVHAIWLRIWKDITYCFAPEVKLALGYKDLDEMLEAYISKRQSVCKSSLYALPLSPLSDLTSENCIILDKSQRSYLCSLWRSNKDVVSYNQAIALFSGLPLHQSSDKVVAQ
jgi:hypothetical protein